MRQTNKLQASVKGLNSALNASVGSARKASGAIQQFGRSAQQAASRGVGKLTAVLGKFGVALGGVALVSGVARLARGSAIAAAELGKLRLALENVAGSNTAQALEAIQRTVDDFNTPIQDATAGFTQLAAAGSAAGFSITELERVFRGLTAANKALGGDTEKLKGILLATTQVFSKGKVAAEELRGQIGERLPGAFALFAQATGRSTAELDKALSDGEVSLKDFVTFAESLLLKYEQDAQIIADGPAEAGARLEKDMANLNTTVGAELADLGAKFQTFASEAIKALNGVLGALGRFGNFMESGLGGLPTDEIERATERLNRAQKNLNKAQFTLLDPNSSASDIRRATQGIKIFGKAVKDAQALLETFKLGPDVPDIISPTTPLDGGGGGGGGGGRRSTIDTAARERERAAEKLARLLERQRQAAIDIVGANRDANLAARERIISENQLLQITIESGKEVADYAQQIRELMETGISFNDAFDLVDTNQKLKGMVDGMTDLTNESKVLADVWNGVGTEITNVFSALISGTEDWNAVLSDTLKSLSQVLLKAGLNALGGGDGKGFFSLLSGGITGRATGGPVSSGTPYLVGEKGPELMVPGRSGSVVPNNALGGSTVVNITINENGGGTTAASGPNKQSAAQMARLIESSTLAIINREKRPGGTLSPRGN
jgi:tape measure domain-containing protein